MRDEQRFKEAVRLRGKMPSFAVDPDEPLYPEPKGKSPKKYLANADVLPVSHETIYSQPAPQTFN